MKTKLQDTSKQYMAYNHNGTALLKKPATKDFAEMQAKGYRYVTQNPAYVAKCNAKGEEL